MQTKEDPSLVKVVEDYHERAISTGSWIDWSESFGARTSARATLG